MERLEERCAARRARRNRHVQPESYAFVCQYCLSHQFDESRCTFRLGQQTFPPISRQGENLVHVSVSYSGSLQRLKNSRLVVQNAPRSNCDRPLQFRSRYPPSTLSLYCGTSYQCS
jgi:hypothetical protein